MHAKCVRRHWDDTVIFIISEFGRTIHKNGDGGTDHGHGTPSGCWAEACAEVASTGDWATRLLRVRILIGCRRKVGPERRRYPAGSSRMGITNNSEGSVFRPMLVLGRTSGHRNGMRCRWP